MPQYNHTVGIPIFPQKADKRGLPSSVSTGAAYEAGAAPPVCKDSVLGKENTISQILPDHRQSRDDEAIAWLVSCPRMADEEHELMGSADEDRNCDRKAEPTETRDHVAVQVGPERIDASVARTEGLAELEIRSLLWIEQKGNEVYARAYKEWEKKDFLFARRIDKKKNQSSSLRNEIYQLIGFYSVFQGVLLTAVAQSNLLHCYNWWSAFSLSLFASVVTIAGVMQKFLAILALEKTIHNEADTRQECIRRARRLLQKRGDFDFNDDAGEGRDRQFRQTKLQWSIAVVAAILLIFSALFLVSIFRVLCRTDRASTAPSPA